MDVYWLFVALIGGLVAYDFQSFLFGIAASPFARIPHRQIFVYTLIGRFFSAFLPSGIGGDVIKGIYLRPYFRNTSEVVTSLIAHRIAGGLTGIMTALLAVSILYTVPSTPLSLEIISSSSRFIMLSGILALACLIAYTLLRRNKLRLNRIWRAYSGVKLYWHRKEILIKLAGGSMVAHGMTVLLCLVVSYSLNMPLSFSQALLASMVTLVFTYFPLTPGNVGVGESVFVYVATNVGVGQDEAITIALLRRLLGYAYALPGGLLYVLHLYQIGSTSRGANVSTNDNNKES